MLTVRWTAKAVSDLSRLHAFLRPVNPRAADRAVQTLASAPERLIDQPRIGQRLEGFNPREVRRIFVGAYEIRYEILEATIVILRLWHGREDR